MTPDLQAAIAQMETLKEQLGELGWMKDIDALDAVLIAARRALMLEELAEDYARLPCETKGVEDLEAGCCGPCRARALLESPEQ